jgi:hypothetical protein
MQATLLVRSAADRQFLFGDPRAAIQHLDRQTAVGPGLDHYLRRTGELLA